MEAFNQVIAALEPILAQKGFSSIEQKSHPEAFGSRHVEFGNGKEFVRLIWDGKEELFLLQSRAVASAASEIGWGDILLVPLKSKLGERKIIEAGVREMRSALSAHLGI
jgi:hypothetical protein